MAIFRRFWWSHVLDPLNCFGRVIQKPRESAHQMRWDFVWICELHISFQNWESLSSWMTLSAKTPKNVPLETWLQTAAFDQVVADKGCRLLISIWVCTFANSQFGEDFGSTLEESPFYCAISVAEETVLVVDRDGGSLTRIWCGLELHFTEKLQKDLQVYTPSGRIGSALVTSGPLVEAIAGWDITSCEATQPSDRRQILNYLANPKGEKDGLIRDEVGNLVLKNGWMKQLEDDSKHESKKRSTGDAEFLHEAELFRKHAETFLKLNQMVQSKVKAAACALDTDTKGCTIDPVDQRGVLLGHLRCFFKNLKLDICEHTRLNYDTVSTRDVVRQILEKHYKFVSYAETTNAGPVCPKYMIEHLWDGRPGLCLKWSNWSV